MEEAKYHIILWNGKYGKEAKFIIKDNSTGKYSVFVPDSPKDVEWVSFDLGKEDEYKGWKDFQNEPVDDLEWIIF